MDQIAKLIAAMTLEEKIGQLTMASGGYAVTGPEISADVSADVRAGRVGRPAEPLGRGVRSGDPENRRRREPPRHPAAHRPRRAAWAQDHIPHSARRSLRLRSRALGGDGPGGGGGGRRMTASR